MDLSTQASVYLEAFQDDMRRNFHLIPNAEYGDRRFPLYGVMQIEETATLLQRNGKSAISYEFCYFDVCDQLDADAVAYYCGILEDMAARYVPWTERSHSFSMLSMVVLVNGAPDKALAKQIRKYKHEEKKKKPEDGYGWCSGRLCIVDMQTGTCYTNRHGSALGNRVKLTARRVTLGL